MKQFSLILLLAVIFWVGACRKSEPKTVQDPLPENPTKLDEIYGGWIWVSSSGSPFVEDEFSSDTLRRKIFFDANDNASYFQNVTVTNTYKYYVTGTLGPYKIEFYYDGAKASESKAEFLDNDTLSLIDQFAQTANNNHIYVRE